MEQKIHLKNILHFLPKVQTMSLHMLTVVTRISVDSKQSLLKRVEAVKQLTTVPSDFSSLPSFCEISSAISFDATR